MMYMKTDTICDSREQTRGPDIVDGMHGRADTPNGRSPLTRRESCQRMRIKRKKTPHHSRIAFLSGKIVLATAPATPSNFTCDQETGSRQKAKRCPACFIADLSRSKVDKTF